MNGFVQNMERLYPGKGFQTINMFNYTAVPVISTLAQEFALFDQWFAAVPGKFPNSNLTPRFNRSEQVFLPQWLFLWPSCKRRGLNKSWLPAKNTLRSIKRSEQVVFNILARWLFSFWTKKYEDKRKFKQIFPVPLIIRGFRERKFSGLQLD